MLALKWIRVAHPMMMYFAWPGLSIGCALFWPLALLLLRKLDRLNLPLAVTFPVVWVALEYVRAHFPTGYPFLEHVHLHQLAGFGWYFLGYTQHHVLPLVQAADLGGVYLVSAAVAAVNGGVYEWVVRSKLVRRLLRWPPAPPRREWVREAYITTGAVALPMLLICYGTMQLAHPPFEKGPRVAAIQGNLPQGDKMVRDGLDPDETPTAREYEPQARLAARGGTEQPRPGPDRLAGDVLAGRLVRRSPRRARRPEVARHGEAGRGLPAEAGRQGGRADPHPLAARAEHPGVGRHRSGGGTTRRS